MDSTARLKLLSRSETCDKCFQQGVAKTSAATVTRYGHSRAKLFAHVYRYMKEENGDKEWRYERNHSPLNFNGHLPLVYTQRRRLC
jgi:hypothetical protein